ncbi:hypothetical protein KQX54_017788 [Cotesia glomerata]|uniref:Uncharacterized protein n=1 Tax=Cotesia glomerata TaxID=32391 RepID=A0AAV7I3V5_COTGL|nr:hypothetical protein KQX54_017788 [Cotesia glomerata]
MSIRSGREVLYIILDPWYYIRGPGSRRALTWSLCQLTNQHDEEKEILEVVSGGSIVAVPAMPAQGGRPSLLRIAQVDRSGKVYPLLHCISHRTGPLGKAADANYTGDYQGLDLAITIHISIQYTSDEHIYEVQCIGFVEYYHRDSCTSARVPGTTARLLFAGSWRLHRRGNKACFYGYNPYSPPHNKRARLFKTILSPSSATILGGLWIDHFGRIPSS